MTLRELLRWGKESLIGEEAAREAWLLLSEALGIDRTQYLLHEQSNIEEENQRRFRQLVERRKKGEPIAYILGSWEFMGLPFEVSPAVLIPRPDTETLVEAVLEQAVEKPGVLDLCTGSGCIAVSIAYYRPKASVTATDLSPEALAIAQRNAQRNGVIVDFRQGDLWEPVPAGRQYDVITSNPPYIDRRQYQKLEPDVRCFEPALALDGGTDGLVFYRRLAEKAAAHLSAAGRAYWEIGYDQGQSVPEIAERSGLRVIEVRKDLAGHDRVVIVERRKTNV